VPQAPPRRAPGRRFCRSRRIRVGFARDCADRKSLNSAHWLALSSSGRVVVAGTARPGAHRAGPCFLAASIVGSASSGRCEQASGEQVPQKRPTNVPVPFSCQNVPRPVFLPRVWGDVRVTQSMLPRRDVAVMCFSHLCDLRLRRRGCGGVRGGAGMVTRGLRSPCPHPNSPVPEFPNSLRRFVPSSLLTLPRALPGREGR
jgi:hypothetical protein